ncbi:MAG: hypothetical protein EZS28_019512 [Streblomastix strix]|uniref:Uncharacterized protein n=1 Tax=Streblomastix strix TaxID=222440 RepID=A0A5J4VR14_9EUKA|nr:MAG: hypothetical protein EZS28_019512 [Streblomastix strix]
MKPGFVIPEVTAWFAGQHKTPKPSLKKQLRIQAKSQLIFDREPMHDSPSAHTYSAISKCNVQTNKYAHVQDIDILFNHWDTQPADQMLTNQDSQIKISEVDLNLSNFNFQNRTALLKFSRKTTNALEQYEVRRSGILNLCPNVTLFTWLKRLREHFHQEITYHSSQFWTEQWKPMSIAKISELLSLHIKKIGIERFTAYSIKHASTTKLAVMRIQERDLNLFTNHAPVSMSARNYYVFAAIKQVNGITARLVIIDDYLENQDSTSTNVSQQMRKNEVSNGDILSLSPSRGDSMLSPFGTSFLPLSHPVFLLNPSSELKVQTNITNITTIPFQTTAVVEWEELRFKSSVERDRAARQQVQDQTPKTSNLFTLLHDSSLGPLLRNEELKSGQSLMIKDQPCLDTSNQRN